MVRLKSNHCSLSGTCCLANVVVVVISMLLSVHLKSLYHRSMVVDLPLFMYRCCKYVSWFWHNIMIPINFPHLLCLTLSSFFDITLQCLYCSVDKLTHTSIPVVLLLWRRKEVQTTDCMTVPSVNQSYWLEGAWHLHWRAEIVSIVWTKFHT